MYRLCFTVLSAAILFFASCQQQTKEAGQKNETENSEKKVVLDLLVGSWVEPNPINDKEVQGIKLNEDGTAESINMATLVYKKWWRQNQELVLVAESIGNKLTITDTTIYQIVELNDKLLEVKSGEYTLKYSRQ